MREKIREDEMKRNVKGACSLELDYPIMDIVEALLANDVKALEEMRERQNELRIAYKQFIGDIDGRDEKKRNSAISKFQRPSKKLKTISNKLYQINFKAEICHEIR